MQSEWYPISIIMFHSSSIFIFSSEMRYKIMCLTLYVLCMYSDMHMFTYPSKELVHKCYFWNGLKWWKIGSNRLQLLVIRLYWCQGGILQIWSRNLHWPWTWKLKHLFFVLLCSEIWEKYRSLTFMIWHFEASEYLLTKFEG